ncbi:FBD-associated F-box protein [Trifolium repens]|nr:FBD-associated F-box protein [Trifolium repens]
MWENKKSKSTKITLSQSATINDLTDDILRHILSFLPIKDAFKTTILSKRWLPLCYSLSVLYFDDNVKIHLRQFMDSVMFSPHSQHQPLKSLTLKFPSHSRYLDGTAADCFTFDIWMEAAKRRKVEKLDFSYLY